MKLLKYTLMEKEREMIMFWYFLPFEYSHILLEDDPSCPTFSSLS